jgi:glutamyl-tRNA synthetase
LVSHLAKLGTSDAVEAAPSLEALAQAQDFAKMGRAPARYDQADLERLNAAVLQHMSYDEAKPRLEALEADLGALFWDTVRQNLHFFHEVTAWVGVIKGDITPVITDAEFIKSAAALLPEPYGRDTWQAWTSAIKEATGAKGKALFMPLRQALTGMEHGPDMGALTFLMGREMIAKRLGHP